MLNDSSPLSFVCGDGVACSETFDSDDHGCVVGLLHPAASPSIFSMMISPRKFSWECK